MKKILLPIFVYLASSATSCLTAEAANHQLVVKEIADRSAGGSGESCGFYRIWSTPGDAVRELLIDELTKLGTVNLLEHEDYLKIGAPERAKRGHSQNPRPRALAVAGVISEFEWCVSGNESGIDVGGLLGVGELSVGARSGKAHVAVDLRLIDLETGKILATFPAEARVEDNGLEFGVDALGVRLNRAQFEKIPLGKAARQAAGEAAKKIAGTVASLAN